MYIQKNKDKKKYIKKLYDVFLEHPQRCPTKKNLTTCFFATRGRDLCQILAGTAEDQRKFQLALG